MNTEENLRTTPSKGTRPGSTSSPSSNTRGSAKKATKNAKITNFFTKVNSPLNKNSNSNAEQSENEHQLIGDELSKDASSSQSMKAPSSGAEDATKNKTTGNKEYVFIIPSSDDDTNISTKGSQTSRRRKPPSVQSNNSKSSDSFILTSANNELTIGRRKRNADSLIDRYESNSNHESTSRTPTRSSSRDSKSRDSMPEKRLKTEHAQNSNHSSAQKVITRIQPTMISCRTKMIDFQSVPSDLNLPRDQAESMIERLFLVKMPEDFFLFWEFAKTINHRKPCSAFSLAHLEWNLVGPYDVLSGLITDFHGFSKEHLLRHCRYYYDPPEFQTLIIKKDENMTHYGYYRDEPSQDKPIVVMNRAALGGQFFEAGDNLFTLLKSELESSIGNLSKSSQEIPTLTSSSTRTPSSSESINKQYQLERAKAKQELTIIRDKLLDFCSTHENVSFESWSRTNTRKANRNAKTLNTIGIVIPKDSEATHRDLGITDTRLKTMLSRISEFKEDKSKCGHYKELQQLISKTNVASSSECDPALCLELGLDLFYQGEEIFHKDVELLLTSAYTKLARLEFLDILKCHLEERNNSDKVSLLD